jgi:SAM-dependent methyltransferase
MILNECLACGSSNSLVKYLDLEQQPLANSYTEEPMGERGSLISYKGKKYPLKANFCTKCSHSQLSYIVPPGEMFSDYKYVSGTTETLRKNFEDLAISSTKEKLKHMSWTDRLSVLDIGSNDGTLLREFTRIPGLTSSQLRILGVDPAENLATAATEAGIPTICGFWSAEMANEMQGEFDIITACNVFAHNLNPLDFLQGCARVLRLGGSLIIEFPYGKNTILHNQFDQFYHEHLNYFTVKSLATLAERALFRINSISETNIHGGSLRITMQRSLGGHCQKVRDMIVAEKSQGLHSINSYHNFSQRVDNNIKNLSNTLSRLKDEGYTIIAYGASAKSAVLFNSKLGHFKRNVLDTIDFMVDDNPMKVGLHCPGTNYLITNSTETISSIGKEDKVAYLLTAWNLTAEIKQRISKIRNSPGDKFVRYVPEVVVE